MEFYNYVEPEPEPAYRYLVAWRERDVVDGMARPLAAVDLEAMLQIA